MKTETCKLYSRDFWIFLPNIIKIDPECCQKFQENITATFWETQNERHNEAENKRNKGTVTRSKQESPAIADKPARRESLPKLLQFDVLTTLSLTIMTYLHAFNCYCVRNPRNPAKFTENSNLWSSRSSKVIDHGANRKLICDLLLVINSNFSHICYRFRDIHG